MTDLSGMIPAEKRAALPERIKTLEAILASGAGSGFSGLRCKRRWKGSGQS